MRALAFSGEKSFMPLRRLVIVTGVSGAGKSQAMKSFEDFGFSAWTICRRSSAPTRST